MNELKTYATLKDRTAALEKGYTSINKTLTEILLTNLALQKQLVALHKRLEKLESE